MSAQDLTTIDSLKEWLPLALGNVTDDSVLGRLVTATSMDFMRATGRPDLLLADYTEVRQGDGARRMIAYHWPIAAVDTLTIGGAAVAASSDKIAAGYFIDSDIDPERQFNVYLNGSVFTDAAPVKLVYSAGYVQPGATAGAGQIPLPSDIEQAVIEWCGYRYKSRPNVATTQRRASEGDAVQPQQVDAPPGVLQVIARYLRCFPSLDRRADEMAERRQRLAARAKN